MTEIAVTYDLAPGTVILDKMVDGDAGVEVVLARIPRGFSVLLRDLDADQPVGAIIYPTLERAKVGMAELFAANTR